VSASKCECSMAITPLGDGCRHCKPQEWIDLLNEWLDEHRARVSELESALQDAVDKEQDPLN
jgi:tryptophanyl-tRNA synthetase